MENFALIFRMDIAASAKPSPKLMERYMKAWMEWVGTIEAKDQLIGGNHFSPSGTVLKPGAQVENNPFVSDGVSVAGYLLIRVANMDEAMVIARNCPILNGENTSVEIRTLASPGD